MVPAWVSMLPGEMFGSSDCDIHKMEFPWVMYTIRGFVFTMLLGAV